MHLRILPEHQKHQNFFFFKKDIFDRQSEKNVFWCICAYLFFKDIFYRLEWLKTCVDAFAFSLPDHVKPFFKKDIFYCLKWLKTCFDAFAHTSRPLETFFQKRYSLPSKVVKDVFWCICSYSQITRNFFSIKIFFLRLEWLKTCFDSFAHTPRPPKSCP